MGFFGGGGGTTVSNMAGATSSTAGTAGLVPAPAAGDDGKVLNGDATFQSPRHPTKANTVFSNRTIGPIGKSTVNSTGGYTQYGGRMYMVPVFIPSQLTSWNIVFATNAANTSNATVGIYNYGTDTGLPKTRIDKSSSFSINSASAATFTTAFTSTLNRGIYFLAISYSAGSVVVQGYNDQLLQWLGYIDSTAVVNLVRYTFTTYGTDDFPATIDTSKLVLTNEQMPRLYLTY